LALPSLHQGVRTQVEEAVRAQGASLPPPLIVANSMSILLRAVASGAACSVMPWGAVADHLRAGTIVATPLQPTMTRRVHVCTARDAPLSLAGQAVRQLLIDVTRRRVHDGEWRGVVLL